MREERRFQEQRKAMVRQQLAARGIRDRSVLRAMSVVPRHLFVSQALQPGAYADQPLPIGEGQTISQPYVVALMSQALAPRGGDNVLEVGTGSGYQAAVLAEMGALVYTIERQTDLAVRARGVLEALGYRNVYLRIADGSLGWPQHAPYEAIIVTAAAPAAPPPLQEQLAAGGRLVIPLGPPGDQTLWRLERRAGGGLRWHSLGPVTFVPLRGEHGWQSNPASSR